MKQSPKDTHIFFAGVGGVAIGPLARIAKDVGYKVSGSDLSQSRYTDGVEADGIKVILDQTADSIAQLHKEQPIDWFVYSSALPEDNPQLKFALENNVKTSKRDEFIANLIKETGLNLIAIAGTHGKTSTTAMLVWAFKDLGIPVSYSIGTHISFGPNGQFREDSSYFVYEADEYDRNFLAFRPELSILTAVDYDHADIYPTVNDYKQAFNQFADQSLKVITWQQIANYLQLKPSDNRHMLEMGAPSLEGLEQLGDHNRQNAALVRTAITDLELAPYDKVTDALNRFPGTERRLELLASNLYTDYAHHPAEIKATLQALSELGKDICVVYQPHQNMRQHELKNEYQDCFAAASQVYWLPTYLSREDNKRVLTPTEMISGLSPGPSYQEANMNEDLKQNIDSFRSQGIVILMAAGDLDDWARENFNKNFKKT